MSASVESYIYSLNTNSNYERFREMRAQLRQAGKPLNSIYLAGGLTLYSGRGQAYVDSIRQMIRNNHFDSYD